MALYSRVVKSCISSAVFFSKFRAINTSISSPSSSSSSSGSICNRYDCRQISQLVKPNNKRVCLVDTLTLVRGLEAQGVPTKQAEAITSAMTEVLNDSLENVSHNFVSKADMQKSEVVQVSNLSQFMNEIKSSQEKLCGETERMCSELRYNMDKNAAAQRLDWNLEKARIRDDLANQNAETGNLNNKLDREIQALRAQLEAAKYDVIKYCIGSIVSICAVGIATMYDVVLWQFIAKLLQEL